MTRRWAGAGLVGLTLVGLALAGVQACPVLGLTGVPCPGCGMVRAALALASGDVAGAWRLHPLVFVAVPAMLAEAAHAARPGRWTWPRGAWAAAAGLFLGVWAFRLVSGTHPDGIHLQRGLLAGVWRAAWTFGGG